MLQLAIRSLLGSLCLDFGDRRFRIAEQRRRATPFHQLSATKALTSCPLSLTLPANQKASYSFASSKNGPSSRRFDLSDLHKLSWRREEAGIDIGFPMSAFRYRFEPCRRFATFWAIIPSDSGPAAAVGRSQPHHSARPAASY
jgi:hypothetical protein